MARRGLSLPGCPPPPGPEARGPGRGTAVPLSCPPGCALVGAVGCRRLLQVLQPDAPLLSLQPTAQGAFLRGSGLSLASGRFTAPVTAIFQFSASLHLGERGGPRVWVGLLLPGGPWHRSPRRGSHRRAASCSEPGSHWGLGQGPTPTRPQPAATPGPVLGSVPRNPPLPAAPSPRPPAQPASPLRPPRGLQPLSPQTAGACRAGPGPGTQCGCSSASRACAIVTREWGPPWMPGVAGGWVGA